MTCHEFIRRYSEYDDSRVPAHEVRRFRAHMASCPSCARYDRVLRKGRMLARQLPGPEPSADFIPRLQRRLLERPRRAFAAGRLAAGLAAVTVLMVAATAMTVLDSGGQGRMHAVFGPQSTGLDVADQTPVRAPSSMRLASARILPAVGSRETRRWSAREVASESPSSYSPLVTGPPAFRSAAPSHEPGDDTHPRALD